MDLLNKCFWWTREIRDQTHQPPPLPHSDSQGIYVITLEINGKILSSERHSIKIEALSIHGKHKVALVIGGLLRLGSILLNK